MSGLDILALGGVAIDVLLGAPTYPALGSETIGQTLHLRVGGSSTNTAVAGAGLGLRTGIIAAVGQDHLGEIASRELAACSVDISGLHRRAGLPTSVSIVIVTPDGHRTMFGYIGASRNLGPQDVPDEAICQAQVVHLTGYSLLAESRRRAFERAITLARQAGVPLSLDPGLATCCQARELLYAVLPEMTLVLLDRKEAGHLVQTDEPRAVIEALQATGVAWVGVKCGAEGCWLAGPDGHNHWLPAFSVGVQDTTGAGDAFDAGVLFGYLRQLGPAAMALLGNALGALACTVWGIGCAMPGRDAVRRLLQEARASEPWVQWQPIIDQTLHALTSQ